MFKRHLIKRSLASGLVIAAVGFPSAAQAMLYGGPSGASTPAASPGLTATSAQDRLAQLQSNVQRRFADQGGWPSATSATPSMATAPSGFQWGDAAIGAGAAAVLLGVGALGTGATRRRRQPVIG